MPDSIPLPCTTCGLPFGRIENGCLVIESRHHGEKHVNVMALTKVIELAGGRTGSSASAHNGPAVSLAELVEADHSGKPQW